MMADPARRRNRPARPKKPYLSEWILTQQEPRRSVLLQVFSGIPERECARRHGMSLDEVTQIARDAARDAPRSMEDEYAMAYYSARSVDEFCRESGQGEGTYKFLTYRYPKSEHRAGSPSAEAGGESAAGRTANPGRSTNLAGGASGRMDSPRKKATPRKAEKPTSARARKAASGADSKAQLGKPEKPAVKHPEDEAEAQRRREARRAARDLERARRLSGDW